MSGAESACCLTRPSALMCVKDENLSKLGQPFKPNLPQPLR